MEYLKKWLTEEGYAKYKEATILAQETSKTDPETNPYDSKYKARDVLKSLKSKIEDFTEDSGYSNGVSSVSLDGINVVLEEREEIVVVKDVLSVDLLLVVLNYELAKNFIDCEEVTTGEEYMAKGLEIASANQSSNLFNTIFISINNQLSIVWSKRGSYEKALGYLLAAESKYTENKAGGVHAPLNYNEIWLDEDDSLKADDRQTFLEEIHTLSLYYLAQVYLKLGKTSTSAKYCHITLVRQMETKQYDPMDWSLNCATLSQYYVTQDLFTLARYCLSCAEVVNQEAFSEFETKEFEEQNEKDRSEEKLHKSRADIFRCWAKYALNLLQVSHQEKAGEVDETRAPLDDDSIDEDNKAYRDLRFPNLEVTMYEEQVNDTIAVDHPLAKALFAFGLSYLEKAKEFYKLDGYVTDFTEVQQDISQFYKYYAFFDNEFENRAKMHKRRIDMLNEILVELNPKHFLQICRQLTFEIADTYSEMVFLKKAIIEEDSRKFSAHSVKKINFLILQGIKYYTGFIDSYEREGKLPEKFEDDDVRGVLLCYFCMARLNSKYCTTDKQTKLKYLYKEKGCYDTIVNYCDENKDMPKVFEEEESVSREMLALFNAKVGNVMSGMA